MNIGDPPPPAAVMAEVERLLPSQPADAATLLAAYIRAAASLLTPQDVARSTGPREILYDLGQAFADLDEPLRALLERIGYGDDDLVDDFENTLQALAQTAGGLQRAADCV